MMPSLTVHTRWRTDVPHIRTNPVQLCDPHPHLHKASPRTNHAGPHPFARRACGRSGAASRRATGCWCGGRCWRGCGAPAPPTPPLHRRSSATRLPSSWCSSSRCAEGRACRASLGPHTAACWSGTSQHHCRPCSQLCRCHSNADTARYRSWLSVLSRCSAEGRYPTNACHNPASLITTAGLLRFGCHGSVIPASLIGAKLPIIHVHCLPSVDRAHERQASPQCRPAQSRRAVTARAWWRILHICVLLAACSCQTLNPVPMLTPISYQALCALCRRSSPPAGRAPSRTSSACWSMARGPRTCSVASSRPWTRTSSLWTSRGQGLVEPPLCPHISQQLALA